MPPNDQTAFFSNLQRLLVEGQFTSSYKYALLIALARWSVENPDHNDALPLDARHLSEHFLELYWPQVRPFGESSRGLAVAESRIPFGCDAEFDWSVVLIQDQGGQRSRVLKLILEEQGLGHWQLRDLPLQRRAVLLNKVRSTIVDMPLWRLQLVGGEQSIPFLYRQGRTKREIVFEPGVVPLLAEFSTLVEQIVRAAWIRLVLRRNADLLGTRASNLEDFLFPTGRANLDLWRTVLRGVQGDQCFYCDGIMINSHVDHFLPWSRYPRDLGHNFVLAHPECNAAKSDLLASVVHLERWVRRNDVHGGELAAEFDRLRSPHDWPTLRRVAKSLYGSVEKARGLVWRSGAERVVLGRGWRGVLGADPGT